jgi:hypothetical protein
MPGCKATVFGPGCTLGGAVATADHFVVVGTRHVAATSGGPVAGDQPAQSTVPAAWISTDAVTWQAKDLPPFRQASVFDVAATSIGLFAVGSIEVGAGGETNPIAWRSSDGISWSIAARLSVPGAFTGIAAGPSGLVAIGGLPGGDTWLSRDAVSWRAENVPAAGNGFVDVAPLGDGFVAIGRSGEGDQPGVIAVRPDLIGEWRVLPQLPELASEALVVRLAVSPDSRQIVAVGNAIDQRPVIFVSPPR